jgi:hypothetical protein
MKNGVFWDVTPCGPLRTDASEEPSASFIRVTRIGCISSQRASVASCSLCSYFTDSCHPDEGGARFLQKVGS